MRAQCLVGIILSVKGHQIFDDLRLCTLHTRQSEENVAEIEGRVLAVRNLWKCSAGIEKV